MMKHYSKKFFTLFFAVLFMFLMTSCQENKKAVELSEANIKDYVNIQLVFGNTERLAMERTQPLSDAKIQYVNTSCMCYIYVSPKTNYNFENASIILSFEQIGLLLQDKWTVNVYEHNFLDGQFIIYLNSKGYGIASVQLTKSTIGDHPITEEFETSIISVTGSVYKPK